MVKKAFVLIVLVTFGFLLHGFIRFEYLEKKQLPEVSQYYITKGPTELGAANVVTSVVVTYRGLDTLGEVTILFAAAAVVGLLMHLSRNSNPVRTDGSELLKTASGILFPLVVLFGVYVFLNGHLTPGGGFQGGAIIASGMMLLVLARPNHVFGHNFVVALEALSGLSYVALATLGLTLSVNGFLDNRVLELGTYGALFSAGLIPIIYSVIGLKVGAELSGVVLNLKGESKGDLTEEEAR